MESWGGELLEWRHLTVTKILCVLIVFFIISHTHSKLEPWFHFSEAHLPEKTAGDTCLSGLQWEYEMLHPLTKGWALHACPQGSLCIVWRGGAENSGKASLAGRNHYGKHIFGSVFFLASSLSIPVFPVCVKWRSLCHKLLPLFCHTLKCEVTAANLNVLGRSNGSSNTTAGWWPTSPCGTTTGRRLMSSLCKHRSSELRWLAGSSWSNSRSQC